MNNDELNKVIENLRHCDEHYDCITVYTFDNAIEAIEQLRKERDEARRMYCGRVSRDVQPDAFDIAKNHGWDCFPQEDELLKEFDNPHHCYPPHLVHAIRLLVNERDEARREVLEGMHPDLRHGYADARGWWGCFKSDTLTQEMSQEGCKEKQ